MEVKKLKIKKVSVNKNSYNKFKRIVDKQNLFKKQRDELKEQLDKINLKIIPTHKLRLDIEPILMISTRYKSPEYFDVIKIVGMCIYTSEGYEDSLGYTYYCLSSIGEDNNKIKEYRDNNWFVASVERDYKIATVEQIVEIFEQFNKFNKKKTTENNIDNLRGWLKQ